MNICQRINAIRVKVPYLVKTKTVESYKAITHDEVTAWVRPYLIEHGVIVCQRQVDGQTHSTGKQTKNGSPIVRYDAVYEFKWVNMDDPTDNIITVFSASAEDYNDKAPGKAASYAAKTNMLKTLNIETGEDDEGRLEGMPETVTDEQLINLREICESYSLPVDETLKAMATKAFKVKKIEDLPLDRFEEAQTLLDRKGKKAAADATKN